MGGARKGQVPGGRPVFACCDLAGGSKPPLCPIWLSCAYVGGMDWSTILVAITQVADAADSPSEWRQVRLVRVEPFRIFDNEFCNFRTMGRMTP